MAGIEAPCVSRFSPRQNGWFCVSVQPLFGLLTLLFCFSAARADDWPQWLGPQRDGVWRETGILNNFPAKGAKVLWRQPIQGGYAGPAVSQGKVVVADFDGDAERVLCLDEKTGDKVWEHKYPCRYTIQ